MNDLPDKTEQVKKEDGVKMDTYFLRALDGFLLVLDIEGDMVYLSDNIAKYLGITQVGRGSQRFVFKEISCIKHVLFGGPVYCLPDSLR